ncbi:MAG: hypothetical protein HQK85_10935, partial [Nitrospinae bacterium]|nr:hypothetical protein [Nitrospinota bacterium]
MMSRLVSFSVALAIATLFSSCGHLPPKKTAAPEAPSFAPVSVESLSFDDDLSAESFIAAVDESLEALARKKQGAEFSFGERTVST